MEYLLREIEKGTLGIDTLKDVQIFKAKTISEIAKLINKTKDGKKLSALVALNFVDELFLMGKLIGKHEQIAKEWMDLSADEVAELNQVFKDNLDIDDDKAELVAMETNRISLELARYVELLAKNL